MKKFLSLLLALTLVLSLVVVPARAAGDTVGAAGGIQITASAQKAVQGDKVTFTASNPTITYQGTTYSGSDVHATYKWDNNDQKTAATYEVTADSTNITAQLIAVLTYTIPSGTEGVAGTTIQATVDKSSGTVTVITKQAKANEDFAKALSFTYNSRPCTKNEDGSITAYSLDGDTSPATWVASATGYTISNAPLTLSNGKLTVTATPSTAIPDIANVTAEVSATVTPANVEVAVDPTNVTILSGGSVKLTATANGFTDPKYSWYDTEDSNKVLGTSKTFTWTLTNSGKSDITKRIQCKVTNGSAPGAPYKVSATKVITVKPAADFSLLVVASPVKFTANSSITLTPTENKVEFTASLLDKDTKPVLSNVTYGYTVSPASPFGFTVTGQTTNKLSVTLNNRSGGSITVTPYATYMGLTVYGTPKTYTISSGTLTAQLPSVQSGSYRDYSYSDLASAALSAIRAKYSSTSGETVTNITGISQDTSSYSCGRVTSNIAYSNGVGSGYMRYQANAVVNTAKINATVTTNYRTCYITFNLPIAPARVAYADQYPEPVASGNTYRYYVEVPSGYKYYYVVGTPNQSTEPNWNLSGQRYDGTTNGRYYLTDTNFVGGKCTLWLITVDFSGAYSCGQLTVYQKNYNINYNGVAGETVQFAQSDFTDFMNEIAEARGDASKTKSYPYVTFDYVTFSLPTTAQGTLYYGGTAMSTSNSSGAFNRNTKVTNLDSVTFVPNDKTTAKTITLNFTLYATRYSSSSTSRGTTVSYSGTVVVNLVREDIKYTVSQGDSVRFDESDFLSYLRSTKGYSSNYTIDYVTFDQSAVSAVNEGSLYTYYNGYNYGGSVKTTDRFYYSAAASQNALSDVAFLASRYAKTGETVYIPFTIYARYGSTGTGTRQLTGTVAIKIGQTMNFIDVKTTDYFYNSVKWAVGKNITNGTSSTTFSPYKSCTRAEIVTFLWRAAGSPEPTITRNPFRDVNAVTHSSYYKAILWASQKGITSGTSATAFSPDQVCTRAQIVTFLYRYAGQPSGYYSNPFKDVGATSEASYYNAILWAVGKGITTGTSATTFSPYASCNRAEAVTFLYRYTNGL